MNPASIPKLIIATCLLFLGWGSFAFVQADIYSYVDKSGVIHFSNIPDSSKYRYYMREVSVAPRNLTRYSSNRYDEVISDASDRYDVDFPIIKAIIKVESDFNPNAVSRAGAMGLMQLMPENVKLFNIENPFDPRQNIMGGARYFKKQLSRYDGSLRLALAAYNAGPRAVDQYNSIPPYPETRNYVRKVMDYYLAFKSE